MTAESSPPSTRSSLRLVTLAWVFGAAWMYITTGAALTRFAQWLDMPKFGFGLLAALPFAGALSQLPASYMVERYGGRKRTFLIAGIIHRALWLAIADSVVGNWTARMARPVARLRSVLRHRQRGGADRAGMAGGPGARAHTRPVLLAPAAGRATGRSRHHAGHRLRA